MIILIQSVTGSVTFKSRPRDPEELYRFRSQDRDRWGDSFHPSHSCACSDESASFSTKIAFRRKLRTEEFKFKCVPIQIKPIRYHWKAL